MPPAPADTMKRAMIVCLIVAAAACVRPLGEMMRTLGDTDDAMRLVEARALLHGRGWWDLIEPRLAPPAGLAVHWSRLVDAPIAALIGLFGAVFGANLGETIARALWPVLLFVPAAWAWLRIAQRLGGPAAMWATAGIAPLCFMVFGQFSPGRLDHHNVQLLLMAGMMLAALDLDRPRNAAFIGAATALSLAVGFEALPIVVWAGGLIAARFVFLKDARGALYFGLALAGVATLAFAAQTPPMWWLRSGCDALQFNGVAGAAVTGLGFAVAGRLPPTNIWMRVAAIAAVGALGAGAFFALHPSCLHGPYADLDPRLGPIWLDRVGEARPLWRVLAKEPVLGVAMSLLPLGALAASVWAITKGRREPGFLALTGLLALTCAVALIQTRGFSMATAAAIPLAAAALARLPKIETMRPMMAGLALGLAASPSLTLTGLRTIVPTDVQAKEKRATHDQGPCETYGAFNAMARLPAGVVMADLDSGPFILAHTKLSAVAAPYHRLGTPIYDAMTVFYQAPDKAAATIAQSGADYVALCRTGVFANEARPGALSYALVNGQPPAWLKPLPDKDGAYLLYRVDQANLPL